MKFEIPRPVKIEHEELHEMLRKATKGPGELGDAAKAVAKLMHPHFLKGSTHCRRSGYCAM